MRVYDADGNVLNTMGTNSVNDYHYLSTTYTNENILTYNVRIGKHETLPCSDIRFKRGEKI
ncbi:hypothetical protein NXW75_16685 [Bacteroides xylanisolvens]|nr:hypothetical protein [Bacteroides xylanisolvens]